MSVDVSQVVELVNNDGYEAMFEAYDSVTPVYRRLGQVINPLDAGVELFGDKGTVFVGHERFKRREDGQQIEKSSTQKAYTWRCAIHQYSRGMVLPSRLLRSNGAKSAVKAKIEAFARDRGETAILDKEDIIAGMFQQGTLTAGNVEYFDNSYPGEADPNRGFIYDGLPWFDGAHTAVSGNTYSNIRTSHELTQTNLQTSLTDMQKTNAKNDRGDRVNIRANALLVPSGSMEYTARQIIQSAQVTGSNNNDINPIQNSLEVIPWSALDDAASASAWWLLALGRGVRIYDTGPPRLWVMTRENGDLVVNAEYYFGACVDQWRYAHCNNKADS